METVAEAGSVGGQGHEALAVAGLAELTIGELRAVFPQWLIFGESGKWWAVRGGLVAWDGPLSLIQHVHTASRLVALAERLCLQEYLDSLDPEELAAVWRDMVLSAAGTAG
jgi:hypothetical protein